MPVHVIREGLPTMLADYLFTCTAGGGFMVRQPVFIPAGVRAEAAGPELSGSDRLPALWAYWPCGYRRRIGDGIPVAIGFDGGFRQTNRAGNFSIFHAGLTVLINQAFLLFGHGVAPI